MRRLPLLPLAVLLLMFVAGCGNGDCADVENQGWLVVALGAFGAGFLTSLTPCVYPMIPITLAIFGARGKDVPRKRAIVLAAMYVGGMCLMYAILGVTFAMIGKAGDFGTQLASAYVVFPLAILFTVLAVSMFGAFDLNLPASWQQKLNTVGGKGFGGAFAMGLVGGLIAAPCTGPFLASLLIYVSTSGKVVTGGSLLFVYGLGMGVLFFALAAFAVALPKSGAWMDKVKSIGGVGLLFAAIYYLLPFLPATRELVGPSYVYLLGSLVLIAVGLALGAVGLSFHGPWSERIRKAVAVALVVAGCTGAWLWHQAPKHTLPYETDEMTAIKRARAEHKLLMIDFSASWCNPCHDMERTFGTDDVYAAITKDFIAVKFDVSDTDSEANDKVKARYDSKTLPSVLFIDPDSHVVYQRIRKELDADKMLKVIEAAAARQVSLNHPGC
ncbi:MAG: cytochrome c biogenesis protein CcdA [Kofleriaceae bacterium]